VADNQNNSSKEDRQYLEYIRQEKYDALKVVRERFLRLHNRFPSKKEESLHLKKNTPQDYYSEPTALEESYPEDYLPGVGMTKVAAAKVAGTLGTGGAALLSMMMKKGPVKAKGVAKKQGGWLGGKDSKMTPTQKSLEEKADKLFAANIPKERIFKETQWFEIAGERRFLDLDFVDEMAAGPLSRKLKGTTTEVITPGPSLSRHVGAQRLQIKDKQYSRDSVRGSTVRGTRLINRNPNRAKEFEESEVAAHEINHIIEYQLGLAGGSSPKWVKNRYLSKQSIMDPEDYGEMSDILGSRIYLHKSGEVASRTLQGYRMLAKNLLAKGVSPEKVKSSLGKVQPKTALKAYENYEGIIPTDMSKVWSTEKQLQKHWPVKKKLKDVNPQEFTMNSEVIDFGTHKQTRDLDKFYKKMQEDVSSLASKT